MVESEGAGARFADNTLTAVSVLAAIAGAIGTLFTALWTNIHIDGHPDDSMLDAMLAVALPAALFLVPPVVVVVVAREMGLSRAQRVFPMVAIPALVFFTFGYALVPVVLLALAWGVPRSLVRRRLTMPPLDVIVVISYWLLFGFFAYAESHR